MIFVSLLDLRQFSTYARKLTGPSQSTGKLNLCKQGGRADKIWGKE